VQACSMSGRFSNPCTLHHKTRMLRRSDDINNTVLPNKPMQPTSIAPARSPRTSPPSYPARPRKNRSDLAVSPVKSWPQLHSTEALPW